MEHNDYIKYKGEIKISIMRRSEVLYEKTFYNKGRKPLFRHLANCLKGDYISAEKDRPLILNIFSIPIKDTGSYGGKQGYNPEKFEPTKTGFKISEYTNSDNLANSTISTFLKSPQLIYTDGKEDICGVEYTFSIPFTTLNTFDDTKGWEDDGYNIAPLNLVALYSKSNYKTLEDPSAYFFVEDTSGKLISLLPKELTSAIGDYSLLVKWRLTISNK